MTRECQFRVQYDAKMFMLVNSYDLRFIERDRGMTYCDAFPGEYDLDSLLHEVRIKRHSPLERPLLYDP